MPPHASSPRPKLPAAILSPMRICLVYDCLYPHTVGGAERWYRNLAERLVADGHEVTYLTLRQWPRGSAPDIDPRVRVVVAGPRMSLYAGPRRRILPPLVFGLGVLVHLLRHGRDYDAVHTCAFPYFSLLAAALARRRARFALVVDWFEVWSETYWRSYLGGLGGRVGALVQRLCARVPQRAFCFSQLHAARLRAEGLATEPTVLRGLYVEERERAQRRPDGTGALADGMAAEPLVVFAGRMIPEKRAPLGAEGVALACERIEGLRGVFFGDGPEREEVLARIERLGAGQSIEAPGFVDSERVDAALSRATCMLLPSSREGYGLIVVEAAARGTPSIVIRGQDNAATELVQDGVNGMVAEAADAEAIAAAIARVHGAGTSLRESTARWYDRNAESLSIESSLTRVVASYSP